MKNTIKNLTRILLLTLALLGVQHTVSAQISRGTPVATCLCPAPTRLAVVNTTSNSITVTWTPPAPPVGGQILGYRVRTTLNGQLISEQQVAGPPYTISGLLSNTLYTVQVFTVCQCGQSQAAQINAKTKGIIIDDVIVQMEPPTGTRTGPANASLLLWGSNNYIEVEAAGKKYALVRMASTRFTLQDEAGTASVNNQPPYHAEITLPATAAPAVILHLYADRVEVISGNAMLYR